MTLHRLLQMQNVKLTISTFGSDYGVGEKETVLGSFSFSFSFSFFFLN